jgi:aldose sugar dehydrogenase
MMRILFHGSLALVLAACGASPSNTATANEIAGEQARVPAPANQGRPFQTQEVATFSTPWAMEFLPGSATRALVTEREGNLWLVDVASGERRQVSGVPSVRVAGQGGLGDVVAHPDFASNQRIYLSYAEAGSGGTSGAAIGYGRLLFTSAAAPGEPVGVSLQDFKVIWRQEPKVTGNGHFAHRIAFAPDGTMFVTSGDRQKLQPAQDPDSDLGKVIRMTDEGERIGGRFYTMGHRNNLGLAFAPDGRLWATEMGPRHGDEINLIVEGRNYGWPEVSYGRHYDDKPIPDDHASRGFEEPKLWWDPAVSPAGMIVYSGNQFPEWHGDILFGALSGQALIRVAIDGDRATKADEWDMGARIREVAQAPDGSVYILEDGRSPGQGRLLRLAPAR